MQSENAPVVAAVSAISLVLLVVALPFARSEATTRALEQALLRPPSSAVPDVTSAAAPSAATSSSAKQEVAGGEGSAKPRDPPRAPRGLEQANTVAELLALLADSPGDRAVLAKLARTQAADPAGLGDALATLQQLFSKHPQDAEDKNLSAIVLRGAQSPTPSHADAAFALLGESMGSIGVDMLFELSDAAGAPKPLAKRAIDTTKRAEVRKLASPALRVALDLRDTNGCGRKAHFAKAAEVGDRRSLKFLTPLTSTKGCGFFAQGDCFSCLGGRGDLNKAIAAINAR